VESGLVSPDERAFKADTSKAIFRFGEAAGQWRLREIKWPFVQIGVIASDSTEYIFRFDCTGYPQFPPTAGLWDPVSGATLPFDRWPLHSGGRVAQVFRTDWQNGTSLYLPCDKVAISTHPNWVVEHPSKLWVPDKGITRYLEIVHELLNCPDYKERPRT
jgi:hypothetical protein